MQNDRLSTLYVRCVRGLERYLHNELIAFGFHQNDLTVSNSSVSISNVSLKHGYFLSYFSRFAKQIYLKITSFACSSSLELLNECKNVEWSKYINPKTSFMVKSDIARNLPNFKSSNYTCLVVKDGIRDYFRNHELNIDLKNPDLTFLLTINSAFESNLYVDFVGSKLYNRRYKQDNSIQDIDHTISNSLLDDSGFTKNSIIKLDDYLHFCSLSSGLQYTNEVNVLRDKISDSFIANYRTNNIIDTSCSIGTTLIESAVFNSGFSVSSLIRQFPYQLLQQNDMPAIESLYKYSNMIREIRQLKLNDCKLIGCEKSWEKINIAVHSANNAGVLRQIKFHQGSPLDTFRYIRDDVVNPIFIFTLPLTGRLARDLRSGNSVEIKKYQQDLLKKLAYQIKASYNSPILVLVIPNFYKKKTIEETVDQKLEGGRTVYFKGINWACYTNIGHIF